MGTVAGQTSEDHGSTGIQAEPEKRRSPRRVIKLTCLGAVLMVCVACGLLGVALQSGPFQMGLVGGNTLSIGSEDFVLSDYSFKAGTTRTLDFEGNGVRTMLQLHYIEDTGTWEIVWHQASRGDITERKLLTCTLPWE